MRKRATLFGASVFIAGSLFTAAPAMAQTTVCAGTANTAVVCTDPTGGTVASDCVYLGPPPCTWVTIPGPTLSCGGALLRDFYCSLF